MNYIMPKTLPGFMELNPYDQIQFNKMKKIISDTYESYGFWPLDTPVIEYSDVLLAKAGGETEKQIYRFNKGDNDLSLRFDLTVPLAKYVAQRYNDLPFPFKRYQIGKVYRGERPQKGRFREFYQCDIDVIGDEILSLQYDVEMPSIIYDIFKKMNIGDFVIKINNRKILNGFFSSLQLKDSYVEILRIIDKIDKIGEIETRNCLNDVINDEKKLDSIMDFIRITGTNEEKILKLKEFNITNDNFTNGICELEYVIDSMKKMGVASENYEIDLTIARGLDYYTGTVYETFLKDHPNIGSICSGGRYDNLAEYYTEKRLPGVGISIGLTRLFYQLKEANIIKSTDNSCADIMILPMDENCYSYVYNINSILRNNGFKTSVCFTNNKLKSKIRYADKCHVKYVIIIGEDEIQNNSITIKNMETGQQEMSKLNDIFNIVKNN
ncbi:MAG: histidine--tRNA ligase [bacterium]|nr:histidine--tRNA ligase [bacterium]